MPLNAATRRAAIALLLVASSARGAEPQTNPPEDDAGAPAVTETVQVTAEPLGAEDVAAFATVLDPGAIEARGQDLADVLRRVPGARVRDYGGIGSYATMSLRASTAEQVTVLVDGVPQNRALGGPVDLSSIPATQIEEITVFRGFGPASLGLGGIGGVVDVRSRRASEKAGGGFALLAGELGSTRLSGDVGLVPTPADRIRIGVEALSSDGDFEYLDTAETLFDPTDDAIRRRTNNDVEQAHLLARYERDLAGGDGLRAALRLQDRERGVPGLGTFTSESARLGETLHDLNVAWTRRAGPRLDAVEVVANGFRQWIDLEDPAGEVGLQAQDQTTRLEGGGVAGVVRTSVGSHRLLLRADARLERAGVVDRTLEASDRGGVERGAASLTVEDLLTRGRVTLAPSVRWERWSDDFTAGSAGAVPPPAADASGEAWSGKLGASWRLGDGATLRGSVGRFHRVPNLLELFGDRGSIAGNPALVPERGLAAELGVASGERGRRVRWSGELVGFGRRTEDLIHFLPVSQGTAKARNIGEVAAHGLEAVVSVQPSSRWSIDAGATVQRATDTSGGFSDGQALAYQPERLGFAGLGYARGRLAIRWDATYTGENSTDALDTPELRIPERVIHDANVGVELRHGLRLGVDARNVFDRRVLDVLRYPLAGRVVLVYLTWGSESEEPG